MTPVAFTGSTSYYGTQTTKIRNIRVQAAAPSLVTFNANGGSVSPYKAYVLRNSNGSLPTPTRKGYTFKGWYTKKSGGTRVTSSTKTMTIYSTKKLYAQWRKSSSSSSSGSSSSSRNCAICHNTRRCTKCGGAGYIYNYVTGKDNRNCTSCNTSGRCLYCR